MAPEPPPDRHVYGRAGGVTGTYWCSRCRRLIDPAYGDHEECDAVVREGRQKRDQ
jgi:hypothetical protein